MSTITLRSGPDAGGLWAITSYFNPIGYRRRPANYRLFRERLNVPLVTVELAYGPDFELTQSDADILVQLRGEDVLWQKSDCSTWLCAIYRARAENSRSWIAMSSSNWRTWANASAICSIGSCSSKCSAASIACGGIGPREKHNRAGAHASVDRRHLSSGVPPAICLRERLGARGRAPPDMHGPMTAPPVSLAARPSGARPCVFRRGGKDILDTCRV